MSDTEHRVIVRFEAETKALKASMDQVTKDAKKMQKQSSSVGKQELGVQKQLKKETEVARKFAKIEVPRLDKTKVKELQTQTKQMQAQSKELRHQYGWMQKMRHLLKTPGGAGGRGGRGGGGFWGGGGFNGFGKGGHGSFGRGRNFSNNAFGGFMRGAGMGLLGLGAMGLGSLISMPFAAVGNDYQSYVSYKRSMAPLAGQAQGMRFGSGATPERVDNFVNKLAKYGYMPEEVTRMAPQFGRATGNFKTTGYGMAAARELGLDPSELASMFGSMRTASGSKFDKNEQREFQRMLFAAVKGGVDASTLPEYLEGVKNLTDRSGSGLGGAVSTLPYAQLLGLFEKSGFAGLKGARGASVAGALEDTIRRPGGGAEGQAVVMASLGFGRMGGTSGFYQAKKAMQMGFQGEASAGVFKNLLDYVDRITGGGEEGNLYMEGLTGGKLTLDQIETVRKAFGEGKSQSEVQKMLESMTASELDVLKNIEKNTSAQAFVEAGELAATLLKDGITRGEQYAESIEAIQRMMQDFLTATMPAVKEVLKGVELLLTELTPAVKSLGAWLEEQFGDGVEGARTDQMNAMAAEMSAATRPLIAAVRGDAEASPDQIEKARQEVQETLAYIQRSYGASASDLGREVGYTDAEGVFHGTPSPLAGDRSMSTAARRRAFNDSGLGDLLMPLYGAVNTLLRQANLNPEGIQGRVDTGREMEIALRALGISANPGDRARVDSTGGAQ